MRPSAWGAALAALACLAACAGHGSDAGAEAAERPITVESRPVPLDPDRPGDERLGALAYAGGVVLTAPGVDGFGGLSGFDVAPDGRFVAQSDAGDLLQGRLVLDGAGRLAGVTATTFGRLTDEAGEPFRGAKSNADAEDITLLPGGGHAVSFEQRPRVLAYARGRGQARRLGVPAEAARFPPNAGLEALTVWTDGEGRPRLVEGAEDGRAWACDMEGHDCRPILSGPPDEAFRLTSLDALPDGRGMVALYRAFDLFRGMRAIVAWVRPEAPPAERVTVLARLSPPLTVDNMEGIAALPNADGSIRLYLISDDNLSTIQRTLLLAFDWRR
jgi:hypothetical protein